MRRLLMTSAVGLALGGLAACGTAQTSVHPNADPPPANIATLTGTSSLADLAAACTRTASADQAGAVVVKGALRDSNKTVAIAVPCAVQLDGTATVNLANDKLDTATLNISDTDAAAGANDVKLSNVTLTGRSDAGLLIELTDPGDSLKVDSSSINYPLGIALRANGTRTLPDSGGTVRLGSTTLTSNGPDSAGVAVTASSSKGVVWAGHLTLDSQRAVMTAENCQAELHGKPVDCSAATLGAQLKQQADQAPR